MGGRGKGEEGKDRSSDMSYEAVKVVWARYGGSLDRIIAAEVVRSGQTLDII